MELEMKAYIETGSYLYNGKYMVWQFQMQKRIRTDSTEIRSLKGGWVEERQMTGRTPITNSEWFSSLPFICLGEMFDKANAASWRKKTNLRLGYESSGR